jgi:hypothetical protein
VLKSIQQSEAMMKKLITTVLLAAMITSCINNKVEQSEILEDCLVEVEMQYEGTDILQDMIQECHEQ